MYDITYTIVKKVIYIRSIIIMWELIKDLIKRGEGVQTRDGFIDDSLGPWCGRKKVNRVLLTLKKNIFRF